MWPSKHGPAETHGYNFAGMENCELHYDDLFTGGGYGLDINWIDPNSGMIRFLVTVMCLRFWSTFAMIRRYSSLE